MDIYLIQLRLSFGIDFSAYGNFIELSMYVEMSSAILKFVISNVYKCLLRQHGFSATAKRKL
jgi:hypothetical protein